MCFGQCGPHGPGVVQHHDISCEHVKMLFLEDSMRVLEVSTVWDVGALETPTNTYHHCLSVVFAVEICGP
jgi:hypothetical protein